MQITHRHDILKLQLQARITGTHPGLGDRLALSQRALEHFTQRLFKLFCGQRLLLMQIDQQLPFSISQLKLLILLCHGCGLLEHGLQ